MTISPLSAAILQHLRTERGPLELDTLIADCSVLPEFIELLGGKRDSWAIQAAVAELIQAGRVRGEDVLEAVPENQWPQVAEAGRLF